MSMFKLAKITILMH